MARSENQGIQIALIVFAFLFILATVGFIYYITENSKNVAEAAKARSDLAELTTRSQLQSKKWDKICELTGFDPNAADEAAVSKEFIDEVYKISDRLSGQGNDRQGNEDPDPTTVPDAVTTILNLDKELQKRGKAVEANKAELARLEAALEKLRDDDAAKIKKLEDDFAAASEAHKTAVAQFEETENELTGKVTELTQKLQARDRELNDAQTELQTAQANFQVEKGEFEDTLQRLQTQLAILRNQSFTTPDGQIRLVNQSAETVWINLGSADNLRPQITFSVWDQESNGLGRDGQARKGAIEVISVNGPHSAEARITQQDSLNPITRGDMISTPLWRPGERLGFALVGSMDFDGDAISDRDRVVQLITSNGGQLDEEYIDASTTEGEMTVNTRYIIVGKSPSGQEEAVSDMLRRADRLGVQRISLADFLERSGYRKSRDSKTFGVGSDPADFDGSTIDNSRFRPRRPPTGVTNGGNR